MAQLFRPGADVIARAAIAALAASPFLIIGALSVFAASPYHTGQGEIVDQAVPFSHQHHVGDLGIDCRFCHASVEHSRFAGMPSTKTCMTCHSQIWTNAAMLAPVRESLASDRPLLWRRVNNLPDYVYFDHSIHIAKGVGCSNCHGDVARMALTVQAKPLTMGWCLSCHRSPGGNLRPRSEIFDTTFTPDNDVPAAAKFLRAYHVRAEGLTDCATCHR
jgi:hypothetical protein